MITEKQLGLDEAKEIGDALGVDWNQCGIDQFRKGLDVELEHGTRDPTRKVTHDELLYTGKIAWAHLNDNPDFYTRFD